MKTLRRLCVALMFTLALAMPVFAGEIHTTVTPPPPTSAPATAGEIGTGDAGEISTGVSAATAPDSVTAVALNLFQSVLTLF